MKRFVLLVAAVALSAPAAMSAQRPRGKATAQPQREAGPPMPSGPSMQETKDWLEKEAPPLLKLTATALDRKAAILTMTDETVRDLHVSDCILSWDTDRVFKIKSALGTDTKPSTLHHEVKLRDLDVAGIVVSELPASPLNDRPEMFLDLKALASSGHGGDIMYVNQRADGDRVVAAIRRAAVLCGAPAPPF